MAEPKIPGSGAINKKAPKFRFGSGLAFFGSGFQVGSPWGVKNSGRVSKIWGFLSASLYDYYTENVSQVSINLPFDAPTTYLPTQFILLGTAGVAPGV